MTDSIIPDKEEVDGPTPSVPTKVIFPFDMYVKHKPVGCRYISTASNIQEKSHYGTNIEEENSNLLTMGY